jgi:hypothetical protein
MVTMPNTNEMLQKSKFLETFQKTKPHTRNLITYSSKDSEVSLMIWRPRKTYWGPQAAIAPTVKVTAIDAIVESIKLGLDVKIQETLIMSNKKNEILRSYFLTR